MTTRFGYRARSTVRRFTGVPIARNASVDHFDIARPSRCNRAPAPGVRRKAVRTPFKTGEPASNADRIEQGTLLNTIQCFLPDSPCAVYSLGITGWPKESPH